MLWWTVNGAGKVLRIDPKDGKILMAVSLEMKRPTSCAFGGLDYGTLLVTSIGGLIPDVKEAPNGGVASIRFADH